MRGFHLGDVGLREVDHVADARVGEFAGRGGEDGGDGGLGAETDDLGLADVFGGLWIEAGGHGHDGAFGYGGTETFAGVADDFAAGADIDGDVAVFPVHEDDLADEVLQDREVYVFLGGGAGRVDDAAETLDLVFELDALAFGLFGDLLVGGGVLIGGAEADFGAADALAKFLVVLDEVLMLLHVGLDGGDVLLQELGIFLGVQVELPGVGGDLAGDGHDVAAEGLHAFDRVVRLGEEGEERLAELGVVGGESVALVGESEVRAVLRHEVGEVLVADVEVFHAFADVGLDGDERVAVASVVGDGFDFDDVGLVAVGVIGLLEHGVRDVGEVGRDGVALLDDLVDGGFELHHGFLDLGRGLVDLELVRTDRCGRVDLAGNFLHCVGDVGACLGQLGTFLEEKRAEDDRDDRDDQDEDVDYLASFAHYRDSCNCVKIFDTLCTLHPV